MTSPEGLAHFSGILRTIELVLDFDTSDLSVMFKAPGSADQSVQGPKVQPGRQVSVGF